MSNGCEGGNARFHDGDMPEHGEGNDKDYICDKWQRCSSGRSGCHADDEVLRVSPVDCSSKMAMVERTHGSSSDNAERHKKWS